MNGKANQLGPVPEDQPITEQDLNLDLVVPSSITMKDVAQIKPPGIKSTAEAILALKIGNARFFSGHKLNSDFSALERRAQILRQTPFAVVLGCSDRVPTEVVYDQQPGDLFVTRIAGNVIEAGTLGSMMIANIRMQVHNIKQDPVVLEAVQKKEIAVIGAYNEISSGAVDFLETEEDLCLNNEELPWKNL